MASNEVTAIINAVLNDKQFQDGVGKMKAKIKEVGKESSSFLEKFNDPSMIATGILGVAAFEALKKVGAAIFDMTKQAGEFIKKNEAFETVFLGVSKEADAMRQSVATDLNLSTEEATKFLTSIQKIQVGMGLGAREAMGFSEQALRVSKALQEFGTGSIEGNLGAIQTAFMGNYKGLRQLGVQLDETEVIIRAQAKGYEVLGGKISQAARETVVMEAITKANAGAMERADKESASSTETMELMAAKGKDIQLAFGLEFQNAFKKGSDSFVPFVKHVGTLENMRVAAMKFFQVLKLGVDVVMFNIRSMFFLFETGARVMIGISRIIYTAITEGPSKAFNEFSDGLKTWGKNVIKMLGDVGSIFVDFAKTAGKALKFDFKGAAAELGKAREAIGEFGKDLKMVTPGGLGSVANIVSDLSALIATGSKDLAKMSEAGGKAGEVIGESMDRAILSIDEANKITAAYYQFIDEKVKAATANAEAEYKKQEEGIKRLRNAGMISEGQKNEMIFKAEEALQQKIFELRVASAKEAFDKVNIVIQDSMKIAEGIFELSQMNMKAAHQELVDGMRDLDDARGTEMRERSEEDYQLEVTRMQEELAAAKETGSSKLIAEKQRNLDRLQSDHAYTIQKTALEDEVNKQERKMKHDSAVADKTMKLVQAGINTATGITAGIAAIPFPPFPAAIAAGILGGVQMGLIAGTPIPEFALGGTAPGGMALVGEQGPELVKLPTGARVNNSRITSELLGGMMMHDRNGGSVVNNHNSKSSSTSQQFSLIAQGVQDPLEFINRAKRQFGVDVFVR